MGVVIRSWEWHVMQVPGKYNAGPLINVLGTRGCPNIVFAGVVAGVCGWCESRDSFIRVNQGCILFVISRWQI